jgi:hypothetical protein
VPHHLLITASQLSNGALLARVRDLAGRERSCTVELVAHLAELDTRPACLGTGRSLYRHCTEVLRLSEHAAYNRIGAARAARRFPVILDLLAEGAVNVTTVTILAPHLTIDNHRALLEEATHRTKDDIKEIVRRLDPLPPAKTVIRGAVRPCDVGDAAATKPDAAGAPVAPGQGDGARTAPAVASEDAFRPGPKTRPLLAASAAPAVVEPRAPGTFRMHVDIDGETRDVVRRLQDLLAREAGGDLSRIVTRALRLLLKEVEREKLAAASRPRRERPAKGGSRHIPASVRRAVWTRDEGRCAFVGTEGRCAERRYLEWHHIVPYAYDGPPTIANISLRCRAHNLYEAEEIFGAFESDGGPGDGGYVWRAATARTRSRPSTKGNTRPHSSIAAG